MDQSKDEKLETSSSEAQGLEAGIEIPYAGSQVMPSQRRSWLRRYGFSMLVLGLCIVMGYYILMQQKQADELPVQGQGAEFSYLDTDGNTVSLSGTNGKARLLYFFASCPDVCPPTTAIMSQVQDELKAEGVFGNKVEFLSVTIDPTHDTPEVLKDYAKRFGTDPKGWKFLRGDEKETFALTEKYDMMAGKDKDGNFYHSNLIVLLDKEGQIRDWISANDYFMEGENNLTPSDMAKKIKSLL